MIVLIHGPAELLRAEALDEIRAAVTEDPGMADFNTVRLEGAQITLAKLRDLCDALPLFAAKRLVIVDGMLKRPASGGRARPAPGSEAPGPEEVPSGDTRQTSISALLDYLDHLPESTDLVFVEEEILSSGPVLRRLLELQRDGHARVVACERPRKSDLPGWIRSRAQRRQVKLDPAAVADLAEFVGDDLRQLDQELIKLATYVVDGKAATRADVRRLVPATRQANVFELVDALGTGDMATAGRVMRHALDVDGEQALGLLGMISRQYRLLIQAKALQARGTRPPEIARLLNVPDWTVSKLATQAGRHSFARLERAMERIVAADESIKTGKMSDREAMDVLLAELALA